MASQSVNPWENFFGYVGQGSSEQVSSKKKSSLGGFLQKISLKVESLRGDPEKIATEIFQQAEGIDQAADKLRCQGKKVFLALARRRDPDDETRVPKLFARALSLSKSAETRRDIIEVACTQAGVKDDFVKNFIYSLSEAMRDRLHSSDSIEKEKAEEEIKRKIAIFKIFVDNCASIQDTEKVASVKKMFSQFLLRNEPIEKWPTSLPQNWPEPNDACSQELFKISIVSIGKTVSSEKGIEAGKFFSLSRVLFGSEITFRGVQIGVSLHVKEALKNYLSLVLTKSKAVNELFPPLDTPKNELVQLFLGFKGNIPANEKKWFKEKLKLFVSSSDIRLQQVKEKLKTGKIAIERAVQEAEQVLGEIRTTRKSSGSFLDNETVDGNYECACLCEKALFEIYTNRNA